MDQTLSLSNSLSPHCELGYGSQSFLRQGMGPSCRCPHSEPHFLSLASPLDMATSSRSSQGLNQLQGAVDAWQRAVAVLPKGDLTLAEQKQRAQYSAELATAQKRLDECGATKHLDGFLLRPLDDDLPWKRALAILPTLTTWESSVSLSPEMTRLYRGLTCGNDLGLGDCYCIPGGSFVITD